LIDYIEVSVCSSLT